MLPNLSNSWKSHKTILQQLQFHIFRQSTVSQKYVEHQTIKAQMKYKYTQKMTQKSSWKQTTFYKTNTHTLKLFLMSHHTSELCQKT